MNKAKLLDSPVMSGNSWAVAGLYAEFTDPTNPTSKKQVRRVGTLFNSNRDKSMSIKLDIMPVSPGWDGRIFFDVLPECRDLNRLLNRYAGGMVNVIAGRYTDNAGLERHRFQRIGKIIPTQSEGCVLQISFLPLGFSWNGWARLVAPKETIAVKPYSYDRVTRTREETEQRAANNIGENW